MVQVLVVSTSAFRAVILTVHHRAREEIDTLAPNAVLGGLSVQISSIALNRATRACISCGMLRSARGNRLFGSLVMLTGLQFYGVIPGNSAVVFTAAPLVRQRICLPPLFSSVDFWLRPLLALSTQP